MSAPAMQPVDLFGPIPSGVVVRKTPVRAHMRRVQGPPPPTGRQLRDAALDAHEADDAKRVALTYIRARLLELYRSRLATNPHATVNADDADALIREWSACPPLRSNNWRGKIFAARGWEQYGEDTPSARPRMHATPIANWRFVEKPKPKRVRRPRPTLAEAP